MRIKLALFLFLIVNSLFGQVDQLVSQYVYGLQLYNPATVGDLNSYVGITVLSRQQWRGISKKIINNGLVLHTPIMQNRLGIGLRTLDQKDGITEQFELGAMGKYKIRLLKGEVSFGLDVGFRRFSEHLDDLVVFDKDDPERQNSVHYAMDISSGIMYQADRFFTGLSIRHLPQHSNVSTQHLYITGGYKYHINQDWSFLPTFLFRYRNNISFIDAKVQVYWQKRIWLALALRSSNQYSFQSGLHLDQFFERLLDPMIIGYAYDTGTSNIYDIAGTTHEVFLTLYLKKKPSLETISKQRKHISPLFF